MRPSSKTHRTTSKVMLDPIPSYVSLVDAGANQTPFRRLKNAEGNEEANMKLAVKSDQIEEGTQIVSITFTKEKFDSAEAVEKWLEEGGYPEGEVVDSGDTFVVTDKNYEESEDVAKSSIELEDEGISLVVVTGEDKEKYEKTEEQLPLDSEDAQEVAGVVTSLEQTATKADEAESVAEAEIATEIEKADACMGEVFAQKYDEWTAYFSDKGSVEDVLKEGLGDGVPIGSNELMSAFFVAAKNSILDGNLEGVRKAGTDLGEFMAKFADFLGMTEEGAAEKAAEFLVPGVPTELTEEGVEDDASTDAEKVDTPEQVEEQDVAEETTLADAMKGFSDMVSEVKGALAALTEKVSETVEKSASLQGEMDELKEKVVQPRNSADDEQPTAGTEPMSAAKRAKLDREEADAAIRREKIQTRLARGVLGIH